MNEDENALTITILIQAHGKVFKYILDSSTEDIFYNVSLLCKAGGFVDYETTAYDEFTLIKKISKHYNRDIDETTTIRDKLKNVKGKLVDNITYDKTIATTLGPPTWWDYFSPMTNLQGIYLLGIHRGRKVVYPKQQSDKVLNLMDLNDLRSLAEMFNTHMPNVEDMSTLFPEQIEYINIENQIKNNEQIGDKEKEIQIKEIRNAYYKQLDKWSLTYEETTGKLSAIKLSVLVKLVKDIIGQPCFINIIDYSCNSPSIYIPEEQISSRYDFNNNNIYSKTGGRRPRALRKTKQTRKQKNRSKRRKSKQYCK